MWKKPIVTILLFPFLLGIHIRAQNLRVQSLTIAEGLSQGFITCLFADRRGFIWIGTFNGLNRYDGYQVERITPDPYSGWSLRANYIHHIAEDREGLLWLSTDKGPVVLDPYSERFLHLADIINDIPKSDVNKLICRPDGRVWMLYRSAGKNGICVLRPPNHLIGSIRTGATKSLPFVVKEVVLSPEIKAPFTWLCMFNDSIPVAADQNGQFCRIDPATLVAQKTTPQALPYKRIGQYGLFFSEQHRHGYIFQILDVPAGQPGNQLQMSEFVQWPGEMPVLLRPGDPVLYQMDTLASGHLIPGPWHAAFYHQFKPYHTLDYASSTASLIDRSGNLWLGTTGYGVRKISKNILNVTRYAPGRTFYNFTFLPDDRVWPGIFNARQVLNLRDGSLEPMSWGKLPLQKGEVYSLLISRKGEWWMVAKDEQKKLKLLRKNNANGAWQSLPVRLSFYKDIAPQLMEDRQGNIWIAGNGGELVRIHPVTHQIFSMYFGGLFPQHGPEQLHSYCLVEDAAGTLWVGTSLGLVQVERPLGEPAFTAFRNEQGRERLFGNEWILSIYPDSNHPDLLWVGTRDGGLCHLNIRERKAVIYTEKNGLANNVVYGILPHDDGSLWLSTNRGLSRFNPHNGTFLNFRDIVPELNTEFNTNAYRRLPSGELAFGSISGLFLIRPLQLPPSLSPPVVAISGIEINGQPLEVNIGNGYVHFKPDNSFALYLPADRNDIVVEFAALQTPDPSLMQYRYRLKGVSQEWIPAGNRHSAHLAGLPPGQYIVEFQAKGYDGTWEKAAVTALYLNIRPHWYRSWPAWMVYVALILVLLRFYTRRNRKPSPAPAGAIRGGQEVAMPVQHGQAADQTDTFLLNLYAIFENNYADDEYGLPQLCRDLEISKSQLQRKLSGLSDQTAMELLRSFRLRKAYDLLQRNPEINVKEVCFMVGFKDPAHFSRLFSRMYGIAPSEVKNRKA